MTACLQLISGANLIESNFNHNIMYTVTNIKYHRHYHERYNMSQNFKKK